MSAPNWITTVSGRRVHPLAMTADEVCIEDIAHALSMQCRFGGHVRDFYSVAQHCVLVSLYCDPEDAMDGLLHDAAEAYLVDLSRPLKRDPRFAFYSVAEAGCFAAIAACFGIAPAHPESVLVTDNRLLVTEARDLRDDPGLSPQDAAAPFTRKITPWSPAAARDAFMARGRLLAFDPEAARRQSLAYAGTDAWGAVAAPPAGEAR